MAVELEFKLQMGKREYLPGLPAVAYLVITNKGIRSISMMDQLDPQFDIVKFYVTHSHKEAPFVPYAVADIVPHVIKLESGRSVRGYAKIFYGSGGYTFPAPGKYDVRATYRGLIDDSGVMIRSNTDNIEIKSPEDEQEAEQVRLIKEMSKLFFSSLKVETI